MKPRTIIAFVAGACLATLVLSVVIAVGFVVITPKHLADVIKKDPETFINAVKEASEKYQKIALKKKLDDQFEKPAQIETEGRVTFGNSKAPVTIVEFSDFQCPACAGASAFVKNILKKYEGKVKLVYRHFPLSFHKMAKPAAIYFEAIALEDHEKAKKFHDSIFENFQEYASLKDEKKIEKQLQALAKKVDADTKKIKENKEKAEKIVLKDMAEANQLRVRGTPTFFINGVQPPDRGNGFEAVIERHLEKL
ncbi:MAG: thioredoxin domain-containing protein [Bdellovibrionales bacterium]|nr:thioredoxin domain-containing protein [Bdellovibrionales bacterium]